jgi:hypothetical protein
MFPGRGRTALGEASAHANMDVFMLLLAAGADLNVRNMPYGRTALHIAVDSGNADIARLLLLYGADANIKNDRVRNSTPLHWASSKGHVDIINLLLQVATSRIPTHSPNHTELQAGADVNEPTNDHRTPLHWAAYWGQAHAAAALLDAGTQHRVIPRPIITDYQSHFLAQALTSMLGIKRARRLCPTPCSSSTRQWRMCYAGVVLSSACLDCHQCKRRVTLTFFAGLPPCCPPTCACAFSSAFSIVTTCSSPCLTGQPPLCVWALLWLPCCSGCAAENLASRI